MHHIRWMIRRDMDRVLEIDSHTQHPNTEDEFTSRLKQRNVIGKVIELEDRIVGFMIYELNKSVLVIERLAIDPMYRRCGFGSAMVRQLTGKLKSGKRERVRVSVDEDNLDGQLFFRSLGLMADRPEDDGVYLMEYDVDGLYAMTQG